MAESVKKDLPAAKPSGRSALKRLRPTQQAFVSSLLDKDSPAFLIGKRAYKAAHPHVTDGSAEVGACRTLGSAKVQEALREELTVRGLDREGVLDELAWNVTQSKTLGKLTEHREAVMASAKVQGFLVDKVEQKVVQDKELDEMRKVVSDVLKGEGTATNG